jgi:hypothetical protein
LDITNSKCEYEHIDALCLFCQSEGSTICLKVYGQKAAAKFVAPSVTQFKFDHPITPDTASGIETKDVHLLQFAYAGGFPRPAFTKAFVAFATRYTPSIESESLRNAMLACACKWWTPGTNKLEVMEKYADLSGRALRTKSSAELDETDFFAASLLAISQPWFGQSAKAEIHLRGLSAILAILLEKYEGIGGLMVRLGPSLGSIFFFLYDIGMDDITGLLPVSPQTRVLFTNNFPCAAALVSYEQRQAYINALGLSQPQEYLPAWSTFLTIWKHYQMLFRSFELARDSELMGLSLSPLVRSVFAEIAEDLESAPVVNAVTDIQLRMMPPEPPAVEDKMERMHVMVLIHHACRLLLTILSEPLGIAHAISNSDVAQSWGEALCEIMQRSMSIEPLTFISRTTASLEAVFPDDIIISMAPIVALLNSNGLEGGKSLGTYLRNYSRANCIEEVANSLDRILSRNWVTRASLPGLSGGRELKSENERNWEDPWIKETLAGR